MAQALQQMKSFKQSAWTDLFPTVTSAADSLLFIKHLTNLAIPTILFLRNVLPETEFDNKVFEGMTLKVLKKRTKNARTDRVQIWLAGAYDALEKRYLKSMSLEIKDTKTDLSLEIYTLNIIDNSRGASMSISILPGQRKNFLFRDQTSNIQLQTVRLLQMCYTVTKSCSDLPGEVTIFMKLSYHENVPRDYHPFGYKPYIPAMPIFMKKTRTFEIGVVNTNHHVIEFMNKTCLCHEPNTPKEGRGKDTEEKVKESESPCYFTNGKKKVQPSKLLSSQNSSISSQTDKIDESYKEISSQSTEDYSQSDSVRCPCLSKIKTSVMYQCSGCNYWVHAECFGIRLGKVLNGVKIFYCQICAKLNKEFDCPDELMTKLKRASDQQKLAVIRRFLSFCNRFEGQEVTFRKLAKISGLACHETLIEKVLLEMITLGALIQQPGRAYRINKSKVAEIMTKFFNTGSISSRPLPIYRYEQMTPLGKRKLENNEKYNGKRNTSNNGAPNASVTKKLTKKFLR